MFGNVPAGILSDDNDPEAAIAALEAVCAQLDFLRGLRERHAAEKLLEIDRHNLVRHTCRPYFQKRAI